MKCYTSNIIIITIIWLYSYFLHCSFAIFELRIYYFDLFSPIIVQLNSAIEVMIKMQCSNNVPKILLGKKNKIKKRQINTSFAIHSIMKHVVPSVSFCKSNKIFFNKLTCSTFLDSYWQSFWVHIG